MSATNTTCPVCGRPAGLERYCPYCDEPLPSDPSLRRKGWAAVALVGGGAFLFAIAPHVAPVSLTFWPSGARGLVFAFFIGSLAGRCTALPLPLLFLLADVPRVPLAVCMGAFAATAALTVPDKSETDGMNLSPGDPAPPDPYRMLSITTCTFTAWALAAFLLPAALLTTGILIREHAGWLLTAVSLGLAVGAEPIECRVPGGRFERSAWALRRALPGTVYWASMLAMGAWLSNTEGRALPSAAGMFLLAPLLGRTGVDKQPHGHACGDIPFPLSGILRASAYPLLLSAALPTAAEQSTALLALALAAIGAHGLVLCLPAVRMRASLSTRASTRSLNWIPTAAVGGWMLLTAGPGSLGAATLVAGLCLAGRLLRLPALTTLVLWAPFLR